MNFCNFWAGGSDIIALYLLLDQCLLGVELKVIPRNIFFGERRTWVRDTPALHCR